MLSRLLQLRIPVNDLQSHIAANTTAPTMRDGTTTMNRTSVTLTFLAMGLLLVLALLN